MDKTSVNKDRKKCDHTKISANAESPLYSVQFTVNRFKSTVYILQCTVFSTVYSLHFTFYSLQSKAYI